MPSFKDATPEQRAEWVRQAKETRARKKAEGIPTVKTDGMAKRTPPPKPGQRNATRDEIRRAIETVNVMLIVGGMGKYALSSEEMAAETDALYLVCQDTPSIGAVLIRGSRFTAWGKLLWVNYVILVRRRLLPDAGGFVSRTEQPAPATVQAETGTARPDTGPERFGEDDAASAAE